MHIHVYVNGLHGAHIQTYLEFCRFDQCLQTVKKNNVRIILCDVVGCWWRKYTNIHRMRCQRLILLDFLFNGFKLRLRPLKGIQVFLSRCGCCCCRIKKESTTPCGTVLVVALVFHFGYMSQVGLWHNNKGVWIGVRLCGQR